MRDLANLLRIRPLEDAGLAACAEDLARLDEYVGLGFEPEGFRGLAVFSSKRFGLWRACPLLEPVCNGLTVSDRPYLAPLLSVTDQYQRFGVALVGEARVRFLEVFMGQVKEHSGMAMQVAGPSPQHWTRIAEKLDGLARNQEYRRIVVGAPPEFSAALSGHLRTFLQHNLIMDETLSPETPARAVLERIVACEAEARKVRESVLAHRLIDLTRSGSGAVLGLADTLDALRRGLVRCLLARDGFAKMGRLCPGCGELSLALTRCTPCGLGTKAVFNVVDAMVQKALDQHCEVVRLLNQTPLDNLGHIGAELCPQGSACPVRTAAERQP